MTAAPPPDPTHPREPNESRDPIDALDSAAKATRLFTALERGIDDPERDVPAPPSIPGYELLSRLGSGGQGDSWLARRTPMSTGMGTLGAGDPLLAAQSTMPASAGAPVDATVHDAAGRRSVVKILRYSSYGFPQFYWRELEALLNLKLDCLPRIEASGIVDGMPWIAMEYVEGADGAHLESLLGWSAKIEFLAQTAEALASLHDAGFVHRDIKPSNILRRGSDGSPAILDLGLATRTAEAGASSTIGIALGTPEFMSPEQARGERTTPKSDQWSIAATALVLLTGKAPHPIAASIEAQLAAACADTPRKVREIEPAIGALLAHALDRALSRDPRDRFADCRAFAAALRHAAGPPQPRQQRRLVWIGIILVIAVLALQPIVNVALRSIAVADRSEQAELSTAESGLSPSGRVVASLAADYPESQFGVAIATAGDLDADGLLEIAIGAPTAPARVRGDSSSSGNPSDGPSTEGAWREKAGEIYIYRGADVLRAAEGDRTLSSPHILEGPWRGGQIGVRLARAGDVNGDGIEDLATITLTTEASGARAAGLLLIEGSRAFASPGATDLARHPTALVPLEVGDGPTAGWIARDVDGDGCSDIVVGEPGRGPERAGGLVIAFGARAWKDVGARRIAVSPPRDVRGFGTTVATIEGNEIVVGAPLGTKSSARRGAIVVGALDFDPARGHVEMLERGRVIGGLDDEWFGMAIDVRVEAPDRAPIESPVDDGATINGHRGFVRIAVGASGIARASGDEGSALLLRLPVGVPFGEYVAPSPHLEPADPTAARPAWIIDAIAGTAEHSHSGSTHPGSADPGSAEATHGDSLGSIRTGMGSLLGTAVAILPDGWAIGEPRDSTRAFAAGAVRLREGASREARAQLRGEARGIHLGNALLALELPRTEQGESEPRCLLLVGTPFADARGKLAAGRVDLLAVDRGEAEPNASTPSAAEPPVSQRKD